VRVRQSRRHWRVEQVLKKNLASVEGAGARHRAAATAAVEKGWPPAKCMKMIPLRPSGSDDGRAVHR
jgi:hypothetical protein